MPIARLAIVPDVDPIVTTEVLVLLHVPGVVASLSVGEEPRQILGAPIIVAGAG